MVPRCPLLRKGIIAASGYLAQMWAQAPVRICPLWRAWHNTHDFASKVVCHETPARFLWILPAAMSGPFCGRECFAQGLHTALWRLILVGMLQLCYNKGKPQLIWDASAPRICREEPCKTNPTKRTLSPHRKIQHKMLPHLFLRRLAMVSRRADGSRKYRLSLKSVQFRLL